MSGKAWHWEKLTTKGQKGTLLGGVTATCLIMIMRVFTYYMQLWKYKELYTRKDDSYCM